jgi:hypothetical protein
MRILGILALIVVAIFVGLMFLGAQGPDTSVYPGRQVPKKYLDELHSLQLLQDGEQIKYFYSDALVDIKDGLYFVTDRNLVLYSDSWAEPKTIVPLRQIVSIDAEYSDSFFEDTQVYISTADGTELCFPVSMEKGLDKRFIEAVQAGSSVGKDGNSRPNQL